MTTWETKVRETVTRILGDRQNQRAQQLNFRKDPLAEKIRKQRLEYRVDGLIAALTTRDSEQLYRWMIDDHENQWVVAKLATDNVFYLIKYDALHVLSKAAWKGIDLSEAFGALYEHLLNEYGSGLEYDGHMAGCVSEIRSGLAANGFEVQENVNWLIRNLCIRGVEALNSAIRQNIMRALEKGKCNKEFAVALVNACNEPYSSGSISSQTKTEDILIVAARNAAIHDVVIEALANGLNDKQQGIAIHSANVLLRIVVEQTDITIAIPELLRALQYENGVISKNAELTLHAATIRASEEVRNSVVREIKKLLESAGFMKRVNGNSPGYVRVITLAAELMAKMELAYSETQGAAQ